MVKSCPGCGGVMYVSELRCGECGVRVSGRFGLSPFSRLSGELYEFLLSFLAARGNIRAVERRLGISYPTVRNRLDELLKVLGLLGSRLDPSEVLDRLERGELGVDEAVELLRRRGIEKEGRMEERMKILNLLAEGKISADEAARLLEALGLSEGRRGFGEFPGDIPGFVSKVVTSELRRIPKIVSEAISGAIQEGPRTFRFSGVDSLRLKMVSGDCEISGGGSGEVMIHSLGGLVRVRRHENEVVARALSGDLEVEVPARIRLQASSVSGDLELRDLEGEIELRTASGDVRLERVKGEVRVATASGDVKGEGLSGRLWVEVGNGDVEASFSSLEGGEIRVLHGDVVLQIPEGSDLILELSASSGVLKVDLPGAEELEAAPGVTRLGLGRRSHTLKVVAQEGDVVIAGR